MSNEHAFIPNGIQYARSEEWGTVEWLTWVKVGKKFELNEYPYQHEYYVLYVSYT